MQESSVKIKIFIGQVVSAFMRFKLVDITVKSSSAGWVCVFISKIRHAQWTSKQSTVTSTAINHLQGSFSVINLDMEMWQTALLLRSVFYVALSMQNVFKMEHLLTAKMPYFYLQVKSTNLSFIVKGVYICYSANRIMCLHYYLSNFLLNFLLSH